MRKITDKRYFAPGFAILGCFITGIVGLVRTFTVTSNLGLIAAAIAFGVVVYVSYENN